MRGAALALCLAACGSPASVPAPPVAPPFPDAGVTPSLEVAILAPPPGAQLSVAQGTLGIEAVTQAVGVPPPESVTLSIGDAGYNVQSGAVATWTVDLQPLPLGVQSIVVTATSGGLSATAVREVTLLSADGG
ncbi:MAG: hypothetical protein ACYCWW_01330 [Deltaproteobacteria bacterium]